MNETAAIVGLYGAVDEAVQESAAGREAVARLLPQYADEDFSWFGEFKDWLIEARPKPAPGVEEETSVEPFPDLEQALQALAGSPPPKCRMRPRRLFALAVALRAFPEMRDRNSELGGLAVQALGVKGIAADGDGAEGLIELLGDEVSLDKAGKAAPNLTLWWDEFLETAHAQGYLNDLGGMRPRPCSGRVVKLADDELAAAFVTEFSTDEAGFDQAIKFLNPSVWEECRPDFWCEVKQLAAPPAGGGAYKYKEVVSSDCSNRSTTWFNAEAELDFVFWTMPNQAAPQVAVTNYQLSQGRPQKGDLILVDEGTLVVAKTGGGQSPLAITTTKRIQFSHGFSAPALALIMCAFGYAETASDLLCCAARKQSAAAKGKIVGAEFPSIEPTVPASGAKARRAAPKANSKPAGAPDAAAGNLAEMFQSSTNMWASLLRGTAKALERSSADLPPPPRTRPRDRKEQ